MGAVLILLVVGSVIGTWILAGIVPTMIHYGLSLLVPSIFMPPPAPSAPSSRWPPATRGPPPAPSAWP